MTAFNQTAIQTLFNGNGATVRAWCLTGLVRESSDFLKNHINGYNLTLDNSKYIAMQTVQGSDQQANSVGAIPFKFVVPLRDKNYKVFVQVKSVGPITTSLLPTFAHCLDSLAYPKTKDGFWVRMGLMVRSTDTFYSGINMNGRGASPVVAPVAGKVLNRSFATESYQMQVLVV